MNPPNLWLMWIMRTRLSRFASPPSSGTAYLQKIIEDAAAEVASHHSERTLDQWNKDKEWLISEGGVTFCDIDRQAFINAAAPLGAELQSEGFFTTPDLYDQTRQFNQ